MIITYDDEGLDQDHKDDDHSPALLTFEAVYVHPLLYLTNRKVRRRPLDSPHRVTDLLLVRLTLTLQPHHHVLVLQTLQLVVLTQGSQLIELTRLHPQHILSMLPNHIDIAATREVSESHAQGMGTDGLHYSLAVDALEKSHLFLVGRSFAVAAGLV